MKGIRPALCLPLGLLVAAPAGAHSSMDLLTSSAAHGGMAEESSPAAGRLLAKRKKKRGKGKKRKKGKKGKRKKQVEETKAPAPTNKAAPAPSTPPPPQAPATPAAAPVLDLTTFDAVDADKAREELIKAPAAEEPDGRKKKKAGFDFGGGADFGADEIDFGGDLVEFDLGTIDVHSAERERFDQALALMSDEEHEAAALEFRFFLEDPKFAEFKPESDYQLAKALYKLGFLEPALKHFRGILNQGASHRRYRKSIEWLFFISRKMADETPVLAELARFRNVTFPKAYRNEYRYLLSKYLFVQAERFVVARMQEKQLARDKSSKAATFDFGAVSDAIDEGGFDFSEDGGGGFDSGSGGGGFDFGGDDDSGGGGFDFGDGGDAGGGGFDFGGGDDGSGGGGFDFGGGGDDAGGGGFDFGGGEPAAPAAAPDPNAPVRQAGPSTAKQAIAQGLDFIQQVKEESVFYPRAKYLEGLLSYLDGGHQKSVKAFQEVVRVLNPRAGGRLDPKLRELAFLSLARVHYEYRQFNRSVYYYDLIDRDSENWLTALFEASWAYFRRGDYEKALGNLLTLHSPFFEREYFPESKIVKAIIYFEACRYGETRGIVDGFLGRFTQVMKEIQRIADSKEAPELLNDRIAQLQAAADEDDEDVTARLVSIALQDPGIRTARAVVNQVKEQDDLWGQMTDDFRQSRLGSELNESLKESVAQRAREAGEVTRAKFERELYALRSLLAQALRIKIEVARSEREALERKLRNESSQDELIPAKESAVVDDEHVYWPYEGEYWRDELGTYELDFSMCRRLASES